MRGRAIFVAVAVYLAASASPSAQVQPQADLALLLAVDCSYSVNTQEFELQKMGLAQAFRNPLVLAAIQAGRHRSIAVALVEWSKPGMQAIAVPWTLVHDGASAEALADRIAAAPRLTADGATSISSLIRFGIAYLAASPVVAARKVIDVSADGRNNSGERIAEARALAQTHGVTVNGLAILNEVKTLDRYFEKYMITGPGAFVVSADDYDHFAAAILRKLLREIGDVPVS